MLKLKSVKLDQESLDKVSGGAIKRWTCCNCGKDLVISNKYLVDENDVMAIVDKKSSKKNCKIATKFACRECVENMDNSEDFEPFHL